MTCAKCQGYCQPERVNVGPICLDYQHCLNCGKWEEVGHVPEGKVETGQGRSAGYRVKCT